MKQILTNLILVTTFVHSKAIDVRFDYLSIEHGLSQVSVTCILQDHQGFMWFGTRDGLNRYDGNEIVVFNHDPDDSNSIVSNDITCLYEDEDGDLWIGTRDGLDKLEIDSNEFLHFKHTPNESNSIADDYIFSIVGDGEFIWIGTWGGGLSRYKKSTGVFTTFRHDPNNPAICTAYICLK